MKSLPQTAGAPGYLRKLDGVTLTESLRKIRFAVRAETAIGAALAKVEIQGAFPRFIGAQGGCVSVGTNGRTTATYESAVWPRAAGANEVKWWSYAMNQLQRCSRLSSGYLPSSGRPLSCTTQRNSPPRKLPISWGSLWDLDERIGACWSDCMTMQTPIYMFAADAGPILHGSDPLICFICVHARQGLPFPA